MTKLVKLVLKNFKSFKKAEIPISNGFTAIVGSNGSGKSNVLDALLFVLGITSLKTLRAAKLTDLVNNNSKENYAKVDLIIKNDGKNFEISRMVDKQGKSVYRLDERRTTLNEINSLLIDLGIDISGHNIVTQGDITKIIEMSSIERREIIDNIAGLSEFDEKKEEAIKELNKVDSRIKEATIILNERNNFLEEMEKEMNAAKEYEALEKEKKQIKATIIYKELYSIEKKLNELEKDLSEYGKQKNDLEQNINKLKEELEQTKQLSKDLNSNVLKSNAEIYEIIGKDFEAKKSNFFMENERIEIKKAQIEKNNVKIKNNEKIINDSKNEQNELQKEFNSKNKKINDIEKEIVEITKQKNELEKIVKNKNEQIIKTESELDEKNKEIENKRKELFDLEVFIKQWEKQKNSNQKKLNELLNEKETEIKKIKEIKEKKIEFEKLKSEELERNLQIIEKKIEEERNTKSFLEAEIEHEKKAVKELEREISKCPICESELGKEKKSSLINQKNKIILEKETLTKSTLTKLKDLFEKQDELHKKTKIFNKLLMEIEVIPELEKNLLIIEKEINVIEDELNQKSFESQIKNRNQVSEKITKIFNEKEAIKEKLKILRTENIFEKYSKVINQQDGLIHNKSLLESNISEISTTLNKINLREESILIENVELNNEIEQYLEEIKNKGPLLKQIENEILNKEKEMSCAKKENEKLIKEKDYAESKLEKIEKEIYSENSKYKKIDSLINNINIEKSKMDVRKKDLDDEAKEFENIEVKNEKSIEELKERNVVISKKLEEIGAVNMKAVENFTELKKEVDEMQEKASKLEVERLSVLDMIDKIDVKRTNVFMNCFNEVNKNFQEMFSKFFNGEGILDLTNPNSPLESGLIIDAKPKGGKLQNIDSMSGGEKTLTALAFMFAIQLYSPAPFYAFDEADAALDKENSMKMASLIEMIAKNSQFIAITHNDTITKKASQIVGVALNKENSSVIGLKLKNTIENN